MDFEGVLCDKACAIISGILSVIITIPVTLAALAFGIMACIPDKKYFKTRDLDYCIGLIVSTATVIGPIVAGIILFGLLYLLLIILKILFLLIVYMIERAHDRCQGYRL